MANLTQKETMLLKDQQKHEQICIQKYQAYAEQAKDPQLQQLFGSLKAQEQQHLNTINQIMTGQTPSMSSQQNAAGQQNASGQPGMSPQAGQAGYASQQFQSGSAGQSGSYAGQSSSLAGAAGSQSDAELCQDMLMTEKYVSGAYDTAIFEFTDNNLRQTLNHIQKEEQQHGEQIFNYMQSNNMYNPQ